jgi:hypothetical protein
MFACQVLLWTASDPRYATAAHAAIECTLAPANVIKAGETRSSFLHLVNFPSWQSTPFEHGNGAGVHCPSVTHGYARVDYIARPV